MMQCEVPRCQRRSRYVSPGKLCGTHWKQWLDTGAKGRKEPKWMLKYRPCRHKWLMTYDDAICIKCGAVGIKHNGNIQIVV